MKKNLFALIVALIFILTPVISFATYDMSSMTNAEIFKVISEHCYCGREYYTEEADGHAIYDCTKCGQNMYVCTCNCWCGAPTVIDTSGNYATVIPRICTGCDKPSIFCDCRSDREAILLAEQQRRTGEISHLNILRPQNAIIPILAVIFAAAFVILRVYADQTNFFDKLLEKLPEEPEYDEDIPEEITEEDKPEEPTPVVPVKEETPIEQKSPAAEKPTVKENKSSGAFRLYKTLAMTDFERNPREISLPEDQPDIVFTSEEISVMLKVVKTEPSENSPFTVTESDTMGDTLANLIMEGLIIKTEDGFTLEENVGRYLSEIANPKTAISFDTVFSGKYTFCACGGDWYSVNGKDEIEIRIFENSEAVCGSINEIFKPTESEKNIPSADISFDYNEFALCSLIQLLGYTEPFEKQDIVRPNVCQKIGKSLELGGFFTFAKTFEVLSTEDGIDQTCESMKKKGLLFESEGRFLCSRTADAMLNCKQLCDCVHLTKKGETDFEIMFAVRENGATAIYDDGESIRVVSAKNIPWKQYIR